jgi:AraC-like DNA-binding protein
MTKGLVEAIAGRGGSPEPILREFGLEHSNLTDPEGFIPTAKLAQLLEEAARATGDDFFGLHFGEGFNPKNIGPVIYVVLNSPTIGAGIENVERYLKINNEAARWFTHLDGERAYVGYELAELGIAKPRQYHEASMVIALNTLRMMAGSHWAPQEIRFTHESPHQTSEHTRIFAAPVRFGCATNAFVVERAFLERQVPAADPQLYKILQRYLNNILSELPREDSFLGSIRKAIAETMRDGDPGLGRVAKQLAASPRTLQRRLKEYGLEFKKLADDTRRRFASNYLKDRKHTLTEVAFLLGYSDVSAFNRAFKRWTGTTPLQYRRKATS